MTSRCVSIRHPTSSRHLGQADRAGRDCSAVGDWIMTEIQVRLPMPRTQISDWRGAGACYEVTGKRVALVNDGWGSADELAMVLERLLRQQYRVARIEHFRANRSKNHESERTSPRSQE